MDGSSRNLSSKVWKSLSVRERTFAFSWADFKSFWRVLVREVVWMLSFLRVSSTASYPSSSLAIWRKMFASFTFWRSNFNNLLKIPNKRPNLHHRPHLLVQNSLLSLKNLHLLPLLHNIPISPITPNRLLSLCPSVYSLKPLQLHQVLYSITPLAPTNILNILQPKWQIVNIHYPLLTCT